MNIEDLNKQQIILLALLVAFVSSIATGITVVTLLEQSPQTIATPINRIIRETVERVVPSEETKQAAALSADETKLLNQLKTVGSFVATINIVDDEGKETLAGQGLFFGDDRVIVTPILPELKEKQNYSVSSIFGNREVSKIISEKDYSILELKKVVETPPPSGDPIVPTDTDPNTPTDTPPAE